MKEVQFVGTAPGQFRTPEVRRAVTVHPGRLEVGGVALSYGPKPREDETPYRSRWYVPVTESADGNAYAIGDPIPAIEAERQGLTGSEDAVYIDEQVAMAALREVEVGHRPGPRWPTAEELGRSMGLSVTPLRSDQCGHCQGTGARSAKVFLAHKAARERDGRPPCECVACGQCRVCAGSGLNQGG